MQNLIDHDHIREVIIPEFRRRIVRDWGDNPEGWELGPEQEGFLNPDVFRSFALLNVLFTDRRPRRADAILCHVRFDMDGVVQTAASLWKEGIADAIWVDGTEGQHRSDPYPRGEPGKIFDGYTAWRQALLKQGVSEDAVRPTAPAYNTPDEVSICLDLAEEFNWETVVLVCNPYQLLRLALTVVGAMKRRKISGLKVHFAVPRVQSWTEEVLGAQGQNDGARINQLLEEFWRIPAYQAKGDLASFDELLEYMLTRDQR